MIDPPLQPLQPQFENQFLHLIIRTRQDVVFRSDTVKSVSSINGKGPFDVLPGHAHFITLIEKKVIVQEQDNTKKQIDVGTGVMHVDDGNIVRVYLETH